jgi:tRNA U38,U39,U40 pseudouridine synthase TruA
MGSAMAVTTGVYPEEAMELALDSPYKVYSPLAPAEGLYLRTITFGRKAVSPVVLTPDEMPEDMGQLVLTAGACCLLTFSWCA